MTGATRIEPLEQGAWKEMAELARAAMPALCWRFRDFGCLEADLDEERELSIHIWHPSLSPPKEWTGILHDHSYVLSSSVLAGTILNHEVLVNPYDGSAPAWTRVVATRSMQGPVPGGPLLKERLCVERLAPQPIPCGHRYWMPMDFFHETSVTDTVVTLMHRIGLVRGRDLSILIPEGALLVRTPKLTRPPDHWIVDRGLDALAERPWTH